MVYKTDTVFSPPSRIGVFCVCGVIVFVLPYLGFVVSALAVWRINSQKEKISLNIAEYIFSWKCTMKRKCTSFIHPCLVKCITELLLPKTVKRIVYFAFFLLGVRV
jgi:hypothetical protein